MGVGNKLPRDIAQFVCRTRPFVDTILLSSTEMRVHRSRPCRWITTIDKAPVNEFPLVKFSSLANHRWTMERSLVRPTNYNELGPFGGIRESPNVENSSGFATRFLTDILTDIFPPSFQQCNSSSSFSPHFFFRVLASPLTSPNCTSKSNSSQQRRPPYYEHFSDSILEIHDQSSYHGDSVQKKVVRIPYPLEIKVGVKRRK